MELWSQLLRSGNFASPFSFFVGAFIFLVLVLLAGYARERRARNEGAVKLADVENIRDPGKGRERIARYARHLFILILVALTAFMWLRPQVEVDASAEGASTSNRDTRYLFIVQDISRSVTSAPEGEEETVFEIQKAATSDFIRGVPADFRVAWYFFSKGRIPYRQPTDKLDSLARSINHHNLIISPETEEEELSQLREFSGGTQMTQALSYTEEMIYELGLEDDLESLAIVLVSDLKYSPIGLASALEELSEKGIRVYTMTHINEKTLRIVAEPFRDNELIRFYNIESQSNMEAAYADILDLEKRREIVEDDPPAYKSALPGIALWMLAFIFAGIVLLGQFAHQTKGGGRI